MENGETEEQSGGRERMDRESERERERERDKKEMKKDVESEQNRNEVGEISTGTVS